LTFPFIYDTLQSSKAVPLNKERVGSVNDNHETGGLTMGKFLYLVSHGDRNNGANPIHTEKGIQQIKNLPIPTDIARFVIGTGNRFHEIWTTTELHHRSGLLAKPIFFSPFCGSADGLDPPDTIVMANGSGCKLSTEYLGLDSPWFDAWGFVDQPDRTLFCSGGELLIALGLKDIYKKGCLYELYPETRTGKLIAQG
jgi:hypothetical protein